MIQTVKEKLQKKFYRKPSEASPHKLIYAQEFLEVFLRNSTEGGIFKSSGDLEYFCNCVETALKHESTSIVAQRAIRRLINEDQKRIFDFFQLKRESQSFETLFLNDALFTNLGFDLQKEMKASSLTHDQKLMCLMSYLPPELENVSGKKFVSQSIEAFRQTNLERTDELLIGYYFKNGWDIYDKLAFFEKVKKNIQDPVAVMEAYLETPGISLKEKKILDLNTSDMDKILESLGQKCIIGYTEIPGSESSALKVKLDPEMKDLLNEFCKAYGVENLDGTKEKLAELEKDKAKSNALNQMNLAMEPLDKFIKDINPLFLSQYKSIDHFNKNTNQIYERYNTFVSKYPGQKIDTAAYLINKFAVNPSASKKMYDIGFNSEILYLTDVFKSFGLQKKSFIVRLLAQTINYCLIFLNLKTQTLAPEKELKDKLITDYGFEDQDVFNVFKAIGINTQGLFDSSIKPMFEEPKNHKPTESVIENQASSVIENQASEKSVAYNVRFFSKNDPVKASAIDPNAKPLKSCLKTSKPTTKTSEPVAKKKVSFSAEGPKSKENTNVNKGNAPHVP